MKIVQINSTCKSGSTGKICASISDLMTESGIENFVLYTCGTSDFDKGIKYADDSEIKTQALKSHLFGNYGFNSKSITRKLIDELSSINPDIVHLHNLHSHNCNLEMLFNYLKSAKTKVIWTFHDCWAFTGYCPHYDMIGCEKWKTECNKCPQSKEYSFMLDKSRKLYERKKQLFENLDLTIITPSQWLANQVRCSFLKKYPVKVINNGIDLSVFKPTKGDFRKRYGIKPDEHILLGVSFIWDKRKGIDCFTELSKRLDGKYRIVLVGVDDSTQKTLPANIISINRTKSQQELAEIYTAADLLLNPTREENYPTVNMEALACGTPVLTFNTGGSPEIIDETCGAVVPKDDIDALEREIIRICAENPYTQEMCLNRAKAFDMNGRFKEYIDLYWEIYSD